ncbi:HAD family hydrolase [Sphingomonas sp.]|uniref:HAD family hydrolase n=1 Tax=Sphingomonas sp. TaxID=28214 RepID=UPI002C8DBBE9|nr:HAD family hydrolase [Sphingomonas sp.]HWK34793.1 HAD family hydrolase [Sphingomonas sp.]
MAMTMTVRAHELSGLLDRAPPGVTTLSLDCFDTLLWRNTHAPRDVFAGIAAPGGGIEPRIWAEGVARRMRFQRDKCREIGLDEIYRRMLTRGTPEEIEAAVAHELALEAAHCFPFAPVVELMRDARARGLRVILVSDMYLSEAELRGLIAASAGDDVLALVDAIFMSSAYGTAKSEDLFPMVLEAIGAAPDQVLHVGDNRAADYEGAARAGLHAVHFQQFDDEVIQRLRLETAAGIMLDPAIRVTVPSYMAHRPAIALRRESDTAYVVGHDVMGPVMHTMATWLKAELDATAARLGQPVRPLFLMRDGYLPYAVFNALYPDAGARPIEISRLTAARASLHTADDVHAFIGEYLDVLPPRALAKQLMLFGHEVDKHLKKRPGEKTEDDKAFRKWLRDPETVRKILKRSRGFTDRLIAHLRANDVADGDAVMLVDVGYKGTVQNIITPVLEREMGLTVGGRYLFLREECISGLDKAGLLGTDLFECRALHALGTCVAVVEQMCNIAQGSTVDYTPEGAPIREESGVKSFQNATRDRVQAACLDFARTAFDGMHRRPSSDDIASRRRMTGSILTRLLFLPLPSEIALFEAFDHDVNLGTKVMIPLLDHDEAADGLRRRGIAYVNETRRMYVPGEIARHGMPLNLSLLTTSRFALDLRNTDFEVGGVEVPVLMLTDSEQTVMKFTAWPTHEGFYRVSVPIGLRRPTVAVQIGTLCDTVQIDRATWTPIREYDGNWGADHSPATTMVDGMSTIAEDLYQCAETGVVIAMPPGDKVRGAQVLTLVFRPLHWRGEAAVARAAA